MAKNSILNRLTLQRSPASKEIGYQNLKIDEPPGSLEANHSSDRDPGALASAATTSPDLHISNSQYVANLHSTSNSVSPPPPANRAGGGGSPLGFRSSRLRRRYPRWCRCICWTCCVLFLLLVLAAIAALCFYIIVRPRAPKLSIDEVEVSSLLLTITDSNATLSDYEFNSLLDLDLLLTINAYNPNTQIVVYYNKIRVDILYRNLQLVSTYVEPFMQGHRERKLAVVEMVGNPSLQKLVSREMSAEMSRNAVNLVAEISAQGKVKVVRTVSPSILVRLTCDLQMRNSPPQDVLVLDKICQWPFHLSDLFVLQEDESPLSL
ncbi:NDR1/HIN1-like protein 10 [Selaginella moellendorffii]|uniref:NDR1/HIN1-like protein 10 n=1 Tax=Selaginella moellendorffii TaxID=88036 RepID=UPI000D1C37ED|nr:NDR1/HIN1-like protein 10 [Selaginella moellendorffii]|eukprot:XP_024516297.1 NDR1/HIN1-like protein 10 [Selaginella moellendorffii]